MIQLLYTNSNKPNQPQISPSNSLGGYISNSIVSNDSDNNLFKQVSRDLIIPSQEYLLLALKNRLNKDITDITISLEAKGDDIGDYYIGVELPNIDECDEEEYQRISNINSRPTSIELFKTNNDGIVNISLADEVLKPNTTIGIWLSRKIDKNKFKPLSNFQIEENCSKKGTEEEVIYKTSLELSFDYSVVDNDSSTSNSISGS